MDIYDKERELVGQFLREAHDDLTELENRAGSESNLFDILRVVRTEICHSNMLAWLLDPDGSHGFNDAFIRRFIQGTINESESVDWSGDDIPFFLADYKSFTVRREWEYMDIVLESPGEKMAICIENKIDSVDGKGQLKTYTNTMDKNFGDDYNQLFIYLTPLGEEPTEEDAKKWIPVGYALVLTELEAVWKNTELSNDTKMILEHYMDILRRDIVDDSEIRELCNDVYRKYSKALDLIYKYREDSDSRVVSAFEKIFKNLSEEDEFKDWLIPDEKALSKTSIVFDTVDLKEMFPHDKDHKTKGIRACYEIKTLKRVGLLFDFKDAEDENRDEFVQTMKETFELTKEPGKKWWTTVTWPIDCLEKRENWGMDDLESDENELKAEFKEILNQIQKGEDRLRKIFNKVYGR